MGNSFTLFTQIQLVLGSFSILVLLPLTAQATALKSISVPVQPRLAEQFILEPSTLTQVPTEIPPATPINPPPSLEPQPEPSPVVPVAPPLPEPPPNLPTPQLPPGFEGVERINVQRFEVRGSTVFSAEKLAEATQAFIGESRTLNDLFAARNAIAQLYTDAGYVTSGAYLPPQELQNGVVIIQVVEGQLEDDIQITRDQTVRRGRRLNDDYIRSRIARAAGRPLNVNRLIEALRLLQLDPRIENLSANLAAGPTLGSSRLTVEVVEADTFNINVGLDNDRSPSVGSFRQQVTASTLNLGGDGERAEISYSRTSGSNAVDLDYEFFLNPSNATLRISGGLSWGDVIEEPFDELEIRSRANFLEVGYRQPLVQRFSEELAIGATLSRQETRTVFLPEEFGGPEPVTINGADDDGFVRVTAVRPFVEWFRRGDRDILALRSQLSVGLPVLGATQNEGDRPDAFFLALRSQAQYARLLAPDTLLLLRAESQLASGSLFTVEQLGLGGRQTVRGYRRDLLLTDNGIQTSAEVRIPLLRARNSGGLLQLAPFIDAGFGWNVSRPDPDPAFILGAGLGLLWQQERFSARVDYGFPIISVEDRGNSLQENGLYFSVSYNF